MPNRLRAVSLRRLAGLAVASAVAFGSVAAAAPADQRADDAKLGRDVFNDLRAKNQIVTDSPYAAILQTVGRRVAHVAGLAERFYVVRGNDLNAFSAPGGYVFVYEGLLRSADNVPELASVLGHETAHLVLGHVKASTRQKAARDNVFGWIRTHLVKTQAQLNTYNVAKAAGNYTFLNFGRQQEYAADLLGATLAARAGYDPWGMVWYSREYERIDGNKGYEQYVQQHPSAEDRIARLKSYFRAHPRTFGRWSSVPPAANGLPS